MAEEKNHTAGAATIDAPGDNIVQVRFQTDVGEGPEAPHPVAKAEFE